MAIADRALVAAQMGAHAGDEFANGDGLEQKIIGAEFEADDAIHFRAVAGEEHDRDIGDLAQIRQLGEGVDRAEALVEQDEVWARVGGQIVQHGGPCADGDRVDAVVGEGFRDFGGEHVIVLDDQHSGEMFAVVGHARSTV